MELTAEKLCPKCQQTLAVSCFGRRKNTLKSYCKPCHNGFNRQLRKQDPEAARKSTMKWRANNPDKWKAGNAKWKENNPGRMTELARNWRHRNPDRELANAKARRANPEYRLRHSISSRIRLLIQGKAGRSTVELLGYSTAELKAHLERQFIAGMSWDNYGDWHVDHIVPVSSFRFENVDDPELKRAWALTNLRPLWASENRRKHAKALYLI